MKWPASITIMRHAQSAYNILRGKKARSVYYARFKEAYRRDYQAEETKVLAQGVQKRWSLGVSDCDTPLTAVGERQSFRTGKKLPQIMSLPDVVLFSPYLRTKRTLEEVARGWPELKNVQWIPDERIREQEHGLSLLYSDWRVFNVLHPEQKRMHDLLGPYWYQFPQGESAAQVRDRCREEVAMLIREYDGQKVLLVTHHLTILSFRANLERPTPEEFIRLDEEEKPVNCGVTQYIGNPNAGRDGRLELKFYNKSLC